MNAPDHERFHDDAGAYLLGALSDEERRAFELHMEQCARCRHEVERLRPAADALPRSVEQLAPPARLKKSIMDVVAREAREDPVRRGRRPLGRVLRGLIPRGAVVRPAIAAGMLLVGLVAGYSVSQLTSDEDRRTIAAEVDDRRAPMASARLRIEGDGEDGAVLTADGLPDLGGERVYQAWVQRGERLIPAPTFVVGRDGAGAVALPEDLSGASAVLVTREERGGAAVPGEPPIMRVDL